MQKYFRRAAIGLLGAAISAISFAQTYTHVETVPVALFVHMKIYKREVVGLAYPTSILEEHNKIDECTGSTEACPWGSDWASLFNNNDAHYYLGYSGGGSVPSGRIYKWFYEYDSYRGHQIWSRVVSNEVVYYRRDRWYHTNITSLQLEDIDAGAPPGEGG